MYKNTIKKLWDSTKLREIAQNDLQIKGKSAKFTSRTKISEKHLEKVFADECAIFEEEQSEIDIADKRRRNIASNSQPAFQIRNRHVR